MRFIRPSWVAHDDSSPSGGTSAVSNGLTIFSLDVHPDDSRIATGGLDAKVRIWSTAPILQPELEDKPELAPKQLAVLGMHTGPVLCVRWTHSGRWLASGSDDSVILVWDLDPSGGGKVWGSNDVNKEGWRVIKRLPGHESDVTGLAWSTADRYLASVGLDSVVMIWDGFTLERIQKLEHHSGFVKGVCWDPAGSFLATCSDDKSVKIFRRTSSQYTNGDRDSWELESSITKPLVDSPGNTFFRHLSWSPDGAHLTVANATNGKGLVYVAAVVSRRTWDSEISLVGHGDAVQAVAFNPHIFLRSPDLGISTQNICSVVALGGDDCSVSIWQTKSARPLIVAREVFGRGVLDMSWSKSGLVLYACSADGTIAVFEFSPDELEGMITEEDQDHYLHNKFESYREFWKYKQEASQAIAEQKPNGVEQSDAKANANGHGQAAASAPAEEQVTTLVARKKKNKKRVGLEGVPSAAIPEANQPSPPIPPPERVRFEQPQSQQPQTTIGFGDRSDSREAQFWSRSKSMGNLAFGRAPDGPGGFMGGAEDPFMGGFGHNVGGDTPMVDAFNQEESPARPTASVPKARTLGGDRVRQNVAVRVLDSGGFGLGGGGGGVVEGGVELESPPLKNVIAAGIGDDVLEARNAEDDKPTEMSYMTGKAASTQWLDYLPTGVILLTLNTAFAAAACANGSVTIYTLTGRRLMPTIMLGHKCAYLDSTKGFLMAVTIKGLLHVWNIKTLSAHHAPVNLAPLFLTTTGSPSPNIRITSIFLRPNGSVIVTLSSGAVFTYDISLLTWVCISSDWWSAGSDAWNPRSRSTNVSSSSLSSSGTPLATLEASLAEVAMVAPNPNANPAIERPPWWNTALTLGHLESRLHACRLLESPGEYKQALLQYVKKIADEGFRAKAEEVIKEFCGPLYWRTGREDKWSPLVCGLLKRDLLKDVLGILVRSKTLTKLALDWQETLKKAASEE